MKYKVERTYFDDNHSYDNFYIIYVKKHWYSEWEAIKNNKSECITLFNEVKIQEYCDLLDKISN